MDFSSIEKLKERLSAMQALQLNVGVPVSANPSRGEGINQAGLAAVHEFGTEHTPERSFMRSTIQENAHYQKEMASVIKKVARGEISPEDALSLVGLQAVGDIQQKIADGIAPDLKESTKLSKKRKYGKNSETPLIAEGELRSGITFEVK